MPNGRENVNLLIRYVIISHITFDSPAMHTNISQKLIKNPVTYQYIQVVSNSNLKHVINFRTTP